MPLLPLSTPNNTTAITTNLNPRTDDDDGFSRLNTLLQRLGHTPARFHMRSTTIYHATVQLDPRTETLLANTSLYLKSKLRIGRKAASQRVAKASLANDLAACLHLVVSASTSLPRLPPSSAFSLSPNGTSDSNSKKKNNKKKKKKKIKSDTNTDTNTGDAGGSGGEAEGDGGNEASTAAPSATLKRKRPQPENAATIDAAAAAASEDNDGAGNDDDAHTAARPNKRRAVAHVGTMV